jgi:hypothetical protein
MPVSSWWRSKDGVMLFQFACALVQDSVSLGQFLIGAQPGSRLAEPELGVALQLPELHDDSMNPAPGLIQREIVQGVIDTR